FVAKYDANGVLLWAKNFGGTGADSATRVGADPVGNIYVAGYFSGTVAFGTITLTSAGGFDAYIAKMDPSGDFTWVSQLGGASADYAYGVGVDDSGNVYATGSFTSSASFSLNGVASGASLTAVGGQGEDAFVAKLDSGGNPLWVKNMGNSGDGDAGG